MRSAAIQLNRPMAPVHAARMMYPRGRDHKPGRSRRVSTADTAVLTDPTLGIKVMAENLGRSVGSVYDATPLHPVKSRDVVYDVVV